MCTRTGNICVCFFFLKVQSSPTICTDAIKHLFLFCIMFTRLLGLPDNMLRKILKEGYQFNIRGESMDGSVEHLTK